MPVFDFECLVCKKKFTELVYGEEKAICPHCQSASSRKLISAFYTISQNTKCDWDDPSLPSKATWEKAKHEASRPKPKPDKLAALRKSPKIKKVKPRKAVHRK